MPLAQLGIFHLYILRKLNQLMISKVNTMESASELLQQSLAYITPISAELPVLDLACGSGRNGLYLLGNDYDVVFADRNIDCLKSIKSELNKPDFVDKKHLASYWPIDFEQVNFTQLANKQYAAIIVFRYLHRALFSQIKQAVAPGGTIVYETFTEDQPNYGRPTNPNFLLKHGELQNLFSDWKIIHYYEGILEGKEVGKQAVAQIIAIKPAR